MIGHTLLLRLATAWLASPRVVAAADGDLDPTFDFDGIARMAGNGQQFMDVAIQPDGKIVAAGTASQSSEDFLIDRYNPDGSLDTSFGAGGVVTTDFGGTDHADAVHVLADARILVAGSRGEFFVGFGTYHDFALAQYNTDGTRDTSFGTDGKVVTSFGVTGLCAACRINDVAFALAIQPDGKIVAGGTSQSFDSSGYVRARAVLVRYEPSGSLDSAFGARGMAMVSMPPPTCLSNSFAEFHDVTLLADGRIAASGYATPVPCAAQRSWLVSRFLGDGTPETTFGAGGNVLQPDQTRCDFTFGTIRGSPQAGFAVEVLGDSSLLVGGTCNNRFTLARYTPAGALDPSFGVNGLSQVALNNWHENPDSSHAFDLALQSDGRAVLAGAFHQQDNPSVWSMGVGRFEPNGALDTSFGTLGTVRSIWGGWGNAVRLQPDGKIVVVGFEGADALAARFQGPPPNTAPTANAGPDQTVDEGAPVILDGAASSDPDGDALDYEWIQVAGPSVTLSSGASLGPTFTAPTVLASGATLSFQLVVDDGSLPSDPDYVDVTVKNVNHPPVADAGDAQTVAEASPVALDASASYDLDGETLSFSWAQVAGSAVMLSGTGAAPAGFTAPLVGASGETLTFEVSAGDGIDTAFDRVGVLVENVNHAPVADAGPDQTVDEGSGVALDGQASDDPDSDPLTYRWSQVAGPAVMLSSDISSTPTFTAPLVGAGGAQLEFELVVDDGLAASEPADRVLVIVQNVNDPPLCGSAQPSVPVLWPPNHKLVAVGITGVSDPNADDLVITVTGVTQDEPVSGLGDGDSSPDAVISGSGVMVRAERAGTGNGRVYRVQFTASDGAGSCTGSVAVCAPHDRKASCTDSGQAYESTAP